MRHLGEVECTDCHGKHSIVAGEGGLLQAMGKCPGPTEKQPKAGVLMSICATVDSLNRTNTAIMEGLEKEDYQVVRSEADQAIRLATHIHELLDSEGIRR